MISALVMGALLYGPQTPEAERIKRLTDFFEPRPGKLLTHDRISFLENSKKPELMNEKFDIIIVDGRDRVNCCYHSISALSDKGVVVLDDSERTKYNDARIFFNKEGFKELSFSGISPGLFYRKSTSVFYKPENCLGI